MTNARATRERLLDAAADILETEGITHLNTNAVAARAGVTPPTVYRNFRNKEAIMEGLAWRFLEVERQWLSEAGASLGPEDSLETLIATVIDQYWDAAHRQRGVVALRGAMRVWPVLKPVEEQSLQNATQSLAAMLTPRLAEAPPRRLDLIARHVVETVCSTIDRCYTLPAEEQAWRLEQLKLAITAYLSAELA